MSLALIVLKWTGKSISEVGGDQDDVMVLLGVSLNRPLGWLEA